MIGTEAEIRGSMVKCGERLLLEGGERGWGVSDQETALEIFHLTTVPFLVITIPTFHVIFIVSPTPLPP